MGTADAAAMLTQTRLCAAVLQEAAYHSVPVISIPLSLGQEEISQFAVDQGRGLVVRKETLMTRQQQPLLQALLQMVGNNSAYKVQVRQLVVCPAAPVALRHPAIMQQCHASCTAANEQHVSCPDQSIN